MTKIYATVLIVHQAGYKFMQFSFKLTKVNFKQESAEKTNLVAK